MTAPTIPDAPLTTAEALAWFDRLEPVRTEELQGGWAGSSVPTGHPLDGVLERFHWHGKRFLGDEQVEPLRFRTAGGAVVAIRPWVAPPQGLDRWPWTWFASPVAPGLFQLLLPLMASTGSHARLRMVEHRGRSTAAMLYDELPIVDLFRRVDADTLLGLMDQKGIAQPFFFLLRREGDQQMRGSSSPEGGSSSRSLP
jgi:hypothetical protein